MLNKIIILLVASTFVVGDTMNVVPPNFFKSTSCSTVIAEDIKTSKELFIGETKDRFKKLKEKEEAAKVAAKIEEETTIPEPEPEPEAHEPEPEQLLNSYERDLLARLVQCEAGGEIFDGKVAVAQVVLNRVASGSFPNTIEEVIYQSNQFQPVSSGIIDTTVPSEESYRAVDQALSGANVVGDCLFFWATYVDGSNPIWNNGYRYQIGNHVFN